MENRLIDAEWTHYRDTVIHPDASEIQLQECRRAFYAGALALYSVAIVPMCIRPTPRNLAFADRLADELNSFSERVLSGEA